jgi:hypothetical protein
MNARLERFMLWLSVVLLVVYGLAFFVLCGLFPPPPPTLDAAQVLLLYTHNNLEFRLGVVIMIITGAFYLPWSVVLSLQMARIEKGRPIWAITQALASVNGTWLLAFPPVLWGLAAFNVSRNPEITLFAHQFAWLVFVTPISWFIIFQLLPVGIVSLSRHNTNPRTAFPRWFGWLTVWIAVLSVPTVFAQVFTSGPFAWNGLFGFYIPFFIYTLWVVCGMVVMLPAIRHQQSAESAA